MFPVCDVRAANEKCSDRSDRKERHVFLLNLSFVYCMEVEECMSRGWCF